ncbi:MAG: thiamine phosphate synthase [Bacillota bacterium]
MLYLITNRHLVSHDAYFHVIGEAAKGGVDAVILREKDLAYDAYVDMAFKAKEIIKGTGTKLILHSHADAVSTCGADGLHRTYGDIVEKKPSHIGLVGASIHSIEEAADAEKQGASYLLAGHIFETDCKKGAAPKGLELLQGIKAQVSIPVIALGGIQPDNVQQVMSAGADGIAVMSYIMTAKDPYRAAKVLKQALTPF